MSHPEFDTAGQPCFLTSQRLRRFAEGMGCKPAHGLTGHVLACIPKSSPPGAATIHSFESVGQQYRIFETTIRKSESAGYVATLPGCRVRRDQANWTRKIFFLRVASGDAQKWRNGAQPHASVKELAALCNPAWQAACRRSNVGSKNSG
jgi:hypothetical protein